MKKDIKELMDEILNKEFKKTLGGYRKNEVDEFLDSIIIFLENLMEAIDDEEKSVDEIRKENLDLRMQLAKSKENLRKLEKDKQLDGLLIDKKITSLEEQLNELKIERKNS